MTQGIFYRIRSIAAHGNRRFFDVGGVLLTQDASVFDGFDRTYGFRSGKSHRLWKKYLRQAHIGKVSSPLEYPELPQLTDLKNRLYETNKPTIGIIRILKELVESYRLGIISNFTSDLDDVLFQIGVLDFFEKVINSSKIGVKKPYSEIYRVSCSNFNISPNEAILVDDNIENVEAARHFGMKSILFTGSDNLRIEMRHYNIGLNLT